MQEMKLICTFFLQLLLLCSGFNLSTVCFSRRGRNDKAEWKGGKEEEEVRERKGVREGWGEAAMGGCKRRGWRHGDSI